MDEKIRKEKRNNKIILAIFIVIAGIFVYYIGGALLRTMIVNIRTHELTAQEEEALIGEFPQYRERISNGKLHSFQYERLVEVRAVLSYLEEKYPGYRFHIYEMVSGTWRTYYISEEISGWDFKLNVDEYEDDCFEIEDNFYGYFIEEEYEAYLEERLKEKVEEIVKINSHMDYMRGIEYDSKVTVEDMIEGELDINPSVFIHIAGKNMQEERCNECIEEIKMELEKMDVRGVYDITFWDMTREKMLGLPAKEYGEYFKSVIIKKEENEWKIIY